jgi:hypothetical protein
MIKNMGRKIDEAMVRRKCDCWIGTYAESEMTCYCEVDKELRYSVFDSESIHSSWRELDEALRMAREYLVDDFHIYDNIEKRKVLTYE